MCLGIAGGMKSTSILAMECLLTAPSSLFNDNGGDKDGASQITRTNKRQICRVGTQ